MPAVLVPLALTIASAVGVGHAPRLTPPLPRPCVQAITGWTRANHTLSTRLAGIARLEAQLAKLDPRNAKRVARLTVDLNHLRSMAEMDDLRVAEAASLVARLCGPA